MVKCWYVSGGERSESNEWNEWRWHGGGAVTRCHLSTRLQKLLKVFWVHTTFGPIIPHKPPRMLPTIWWFQLRDRSIKLTSGQFTSPQWIVAIDLITICDHCDIYLLHRSMMLVDLRSVVCDHFRSSSFRSFNTYFLPSSRVSYLRSEGYVSR
jgi:hypothetical protein